MPYDTRTILSASRYFLAKTKSACGANAQGGGGFQPGNTCAVKNKKMDESGVLKVNGKWTVEGADPEKTVYWRIHSEQFDEHDLHKNHVSNLWIHGSSSDDAAAEGLSTVDSLEGLVDYFAGSPLDGNSPGRGAYLNGVHLVALHGEDSKGVAWDEGETLMHPDTLVASIPVEKTPFLELLEEKINERFDDRPWGARYQYDSKNDSWELVPQWPKDLSRDAMDALDEDNPLDFIKLIRKNKDLADAYEEESPGVIKEIETYVKRQ